MMEMSLPNPDLVNTSKNSFKKRKSSNSFWQHVQNIRTVWYLNFQPKKQLHFNISTAEMKLNMSLDQIKH